MVLLLITVQLYTIYRTNLPLREIVTLFQVGFLRFRITNLIQSRPQLCGFLATPLHTTTKDGHRLREHV